MSKTNEELIALLKALELPLLKYIELSPEFPEDIYLARDIGEAFGKLEAAIKERK